MLRFYVRPYDEVLAAGRRVAFKLDEKRRIPGTVVLSRSDKCDVRRDDTGSISTCKMADLVEPDGSALKHVDLRYAFSRSTHAGRQKEVKRQLRDRGLKPETVWRARIGYWGDPCLRIPEKVMGFTIPWFDAGTLKKLMFRLPDNWNAKYINAYSASPLAYPSRSAIIPGKPLIVTEGEFDCLLLTQEIGDLASVITTGSANDPPAPELIERARSASVVYAAHDDDAGGKAAAALWPGAKRILPLAGKDWTDSWLAGERIKEFWSFMIES